MNKIAQRIFGVVIMAFLLLKLALIIGMPLPKESQPKFIQSALIWYWQEIKDIDPIFAPKLNEIYTPAALPFQVDLDRLPNVSNHQNNVQYTARHDIPDIYFDKDGKLIDAPAQDGYYRKVLGKYNGNQWVIQDFYQDTKQPQTNITKLQVNADYKNFDITITDGEVAHFNRQGKLSALTLINQEQGNGMYFKDKTVIAQSIEYHKTNDNTVLIFDDQQKTIAIIRPKDEKVTIYILYPNLQSVLAIIKGENNSSKQPEALYFGENGYPLPGNKLSESLTSHIDTTLAKISDTINHIENE